MVKTGLDVLVAQEFAPLRGMRVGLVTHPAAVDARLRHAIELLAAAPGVKLTAIFGPEHGLLGQAQDLIGVSAGESKIAAGSVHSLYGEDEASLHPRPEHFVDVDVVVIDMQDVGSRYYTFQATMLYCLKVALGMGRRVMVLDRPNPISGLVVEGPALGPGFQSFVGVHDLAIRHGLTMGELAIFYQRELNLDQGELTVVNCEGWKPGTTTNRPGCPGCCPPPTCRRRKPRWSIPGNV